jgi:hypothetical protein
VNKIYFIVKFYYFLLKVSTEDKRRIQTEMIKTREDGWPQRTIRLPATTNFRQVKLWDLVDSTSTSAMRSLGIEEHFLLETDPDLWTESEQFRNYRERIKSIAVTNDVAERAIGLITNLTKDPRTRNENELQRTIQVVEENRRNIDKNSHHRL